MNCIVCGGKEVRILHKENILSNNSISLKERFKSTNTITFTHTNQVVKCKNCGFVYMDRQPDSNAIIKNAYSEVNDVLYLKNSEAKILTFQKVMDQIEKYVPKGRLLDIGCYYGFLLHVARERHWDVAGVELCHEAVKYVKESFGINVFNGVLKDAAYPDNYFDVATILAVIEHLCDPRIELKEIGRILKKNGILVIATHNIESMIAKIMGKNYPWLCEMHLYHFSPRTLEKLLKNMGFKVINYYSYGQIYNLGYVGQRIGASNLFYRIIGKILNIAPISGLNVSIDTRDAFLTIAKKT